jgi:hypothetical protein
VAAERWLSWLQVMIPLFDGILLGGFITNIYPVLGTTQPMILTNITAFCCLLAVSGGMRLRRRSVAITTAAALINFSYGAVLFGLDVAVTLFAAFTILGIGLVAPLDVQHCPSPNPERSRTGLDGAVFA